MQKLASASCRSFCSSQASNKTLLWVSDSKMIAVNPHSSSWTMEHLYRPDFNWKHYANNSVLRMASLYSFAVTENTKCRGTLTVLLFKTTQSLLSSLARQVSFYVGGEGFIAAFSSRIWKRSRRLLCCCPEPCTSFLLRRICYRLCKEQKGYWMWPVYVTFT